MMAEPGTRRERRIWKQHQETLVADGDFVVGRVVPLVPELTRRSASVDWTAEIVRSKASDRITVRYTFGSVAVIYGKIYFDRSLGRGTLASLARLWEQGFAAGFGLEIPEPLGFIEEANLLLMRRAEGTSLNDLAASGVLDEALTSARAAARWLAKYHATDIAGLPVQAPCETIEILKIADALAKAAAERQDHSCLLISMLRDLHAVAPRRSSPARLVPLHGQFRPAHVFTDGNRAVVIDIEKICLSDPAKDVARFVHALKKTCFEEGGNVQRADQLAQEFVAEYRKHAPSNLENLAYFRALLALKALAKLLNSHKVDEYKRRVITEMYCFEFERASQGMTTVAA
jgi:aminoglycoside phosphotransferase (APT) family kinase protein